MVPYLKIIIDYLYGINSVMIALYAKKRSFHHLYINDNQLSKAQPQP